jgi:succinate dehydrogenase flavin-adding protein (antitoxin of CptAB toxin-antitoxin module)
MEQPLSLSEIQKIYSDSIRVQIEDLKAQNLDPDLDYTFDLLLRKTDPELLSILSHAGEMPTEFLADLPETPERSETF